MSKETALLIHVNSDIVSYHRQNGISSCSYRMVMTRIPRGVEKVFLIKSGQGKCMTIDKGNCTKWLINEQLIDNRKLGDK